MNALKKLALFIWQLPQMLLGYLLLFLVYTPKYVVEVDGVKIYFVDRMAKSINFGQMSFITSRLYRVGCDISELAVVRHEVGHSKQSRRLSWLYLFVITIPALVWAARFPKKKMRSTRFYDFFTERWADRLGDVKRSK